MAALADTVTARGMVSEQNLAAAVERQAIYGGSLDKKYEVPEHRARANLWLRRHTELPRAEHRALANAHARDAHRGEAAA